MGCAFTLELRIGDSAVRIGSREKARVPACYIVVRVIIVEGAYVMKLPGKVGHTRGQVGTLLHDESHKIKYI